MGTPTLLLARTELRGMAANDEPVPVRTLAQAARLLHETHQLGQYAVTVGVPVLDPGESRCLKVPALAASLDRNRLCLQLLINGAGTEV
jgi:hypothetical protein